MMLDMLGFEHNFEVSLASEPTEVNFQFAPRNVSSTKRKSKLHLEVESVDAILTVRPNASSSWCGRFQGGVGRRSGIFGTPNPEMMCVVLRGEGYWVPVLDPINYLSIDCIPVTQVIPVVGAGLVVFVSFTKVSAYGADGKHWSTDDVSWDGIKIKSISATAILGSGWDAPSGKDAPFSIDISSGRVFGGSSPKLSSARSR